MKKSFFYFFGALMTLALLNLSSCKKPTNPPENNGTETPNDDNGGENGNGNGGNNGQGGGGGQTGAAADIFKAFDQVGNSFWYAWNSSSSYVAYGKGTQHSSSRKCISWEVVDVSGNTATVAEYENLNFSKPSYITFRRGSDGSLFLNNYQITNTQTPEFYGLTFGKSNLTYEWKETYNSGAYSNIFYSKSNGYTTTKTSYDISETWNEFGLSYSKCSTISDDASVGSYSKTQTLRSAYTAYNTYGANNDVPAITVKRIEVHRYNQVDDYVKANPGACRYSVTFTCPATATTAWGVAIGIYMNDGNGGVKCYPCYQVSDLTNYIKAHGVNYSAQDVATDELIHCIEFKGDNSEYEYDFYMTSEGTALVERVGSLSFGLIALGYGQVSEVKQESSFSIMSSNSSSAPKRLAKHIQSVDGMPVKTTPAQPITFSGQTMHSVR